MIRLTLALLVLSASLASADQVATREARAEIAPEPGGPGGGAPARPMARIRPPRDPVPITQPELQSLVRSLPPLLRNQHQQCMRQFQPDRRVRARVVVRMRPGIPLQMELQTRPNNPQLEQCLQRWTLRALRSRLGRRTARAPLRALSAFVLEPMPVVDIPPQPNQNAVAVRQTVERALAGQRSIFRRCFANGAVAGVATLRIQVQPDGSLQLLGASVPPDTGTAPLNCLAQLVATTPTGLTGNVPQQTVEWTIQLMEPMPGTEPL